MRRSMLLAGLAAASLALAGCGSNSLSGGPAHKGGNVSVGVDSAAAAEVPASLKKKGTLTIGTDASYAPSEFLAGDGKTVEGFDVDLFNAVAKKLGLKTDFQNASFDTIITGVTGGKYDMGVSSFTINADRMKQVDMVSYFNAGTQWAAQPSEAAKVDPQKPCGLKVAVQKGTTQLIDDLPSKIKACKAAGKPIDVLVYDKQDQATAAVVAGKAQAMLADSPVIAYAVKQSGGKIQAVGSIYDAAPYGYVIPKNDGKLGQAIVTALKSLDKSGDYQKILKNWGVEQGAIHDFAVNP
ncbi:MAG TPA: ABC transporter substrate-binding protein [Marmoricola sp.]|nr:ABC transporter substrate-binding protein [Marmoricola sp.]